MRFPRLFRKLWFSLSYRKEQVVELDLSRCHWSVAASIWDLKHSKAILRKPKPWDELVNYLGVSAEYKPVIKQVILSALYDMGDTRRGSRKKPADAPTLRSLFLNGDPDKFFPTKGLNKPALWIKFCKHPAVAELLRERKGIVSRIEMIGGAEDCDGNWINFRADDGKLMPLTTMSYVLQSYEQKIISAALAEVARQKQLYVMAYTYDGIVVYCSDPSKSRKQINAVKAAAKQCATELRVETELVEESLVTDEFWDMITEAINEIPEPEITPVSENVVCLA